MRTLVHTLRDRAAALRPAPLTDTRIVFGALAEGVRRHADGFPAALTAGGLTAYEHRVYSQNGEDGVIAEIVRRLGRSASPAFVEFGVESGHEGNCVFLADVMGWSGLFIEADPGSYDALERKYAGSGRVRTLRSVVTAANVDALFRRGCVPVDVDLVSIDIDGDDYWVWQALTAVRPRIVVVEYNAALGPTRALVQHNTLDGLAYDGSDAFGASLAALEALAHEKGYRLVHTDQCGVNAFFVREDLGLDPPIAVETPRRACNFGLTGGAPARRTTDDRFIDLNSAAGDIGPTTRNAV